MTAMDELIEVFGEPISVYTRQQAIADGALVDVTEWASPREMMGGFTCPVVMTRALWTKVDVDSKKGHRGWNSTRGVAHDVLWMGSVAAKSYCRRHKEGGSGFGFAYVVRIGARNVRLHLEADGDGITIGMPEDF